MIGPVLAEATVAQFVRLIGERGGLGVVGGEHDGHAPLAAELAQQAEHFPGALRVEACRSARPPARASG